MTDFVKFMASTNGRILRIVVGLIVGAIGLFATTGAAQIVLLVLGALFILVGVIDICIFAPLFGQAIQGAKIRGEE